MKYISKFNESTRERFLINIKYSAPVGWFSNTIEVAKTNLYFARAEGVLESYEQKYKNDDDKENICYWFKLISYLNKEDLEKYFKNNITRIEKIEIL